MQTNDSNRSGIKVSISGIVLGELKALPPVVFFGEVKTDTRVERKITLYSTNGKRLEISKASSESPYITTEVKTVDNGSKFKLVAMLQSPKNETTLRDNIPVYINGKNEPAIEIPFYARVMDSKK